MRLGTLRIATLIVAIATGLPWRLAFADDTALVELKSVKVSVLPEGMGLLAFKIRNSVEVKLRQAGIEVTENGPVELRVMTVSVDLDPEQKQFLGKYGTVALKLYEPVVLDRTKKPMAVACTWEGPTMTMHGPPDNFSDRVHQTANDLTDAFLNRWFKARAGSKPERTEKSDAK